MRNFILPKLNFLISLIFVLQLANCSGGGGGGSSSGSGVQSNLETQNKNVETYFSKAEEFMTANKSMDDWISTVNPTDITSIDSINRTIADYLVPLSEEIQAAGSQVYQNEQNIQSRSSTSENARLINGDEISTAVTPIAVIGVCMAGLTAVSWGMSLNDNLKKVTKRKKQCGDEYKGSISSIPAGITLEKQDELVRSYYEAWRQCIAAAEEEFTEEQTISTFGAFLTTFGPGAATTRLGRITLQSLSGANDVTNIYVIGTSSDSNGKRSNGREGEGADSFIAKADSNGEFSAPEGDWNLVMFKTGYARFGTKTGQSVSVGDGQTTLIQASTVPVSEATSNDLKSCEDTGGDTGGGGGDLSFPATYSGKGTHVSKASVTWGKQGSVTCESQIDWEITLNADGSLTGAYYTTTGAGYDGNIGNAYCSEYAPFKNTIYGGSHSNGTFTFDIYTGYPLAGTYSSSSLSGSMSINQTLNFNNGQSFLYDSHTINLPWTK